MPLHKGFTAIELIIWILVAGLLLAALSLFITRGVTINREQFQQILTTEDARIQLERMSDMIRNARDSGETGSWLVAADDYSITVMSNADADADPEEIRYFLDNSDLKRGIKESGEAEVVNVVAGTVVNLRESHPLFTYFDPEGNQVIAADATGLNIDKVGLSLIIDPEQHDVPGPVTVDTVIFPRGNLSAGNTVALLPAEFHLPGDPPADDDARITLDAGGLGQTEETIHMIFLNDGRVTTFHDSYYANVNYQPDTLDGDPPGWYVWIGPIVVGKSGSQEYTATDKVPINEVCTGSDLDSILQSCSERTVSDPSGTLTASYKPVLTYRSDSAPADTSYYVRGIFFDGP